MSPLCSCVLQVHPPAMMVDAGRVFFLSLLLSLGTATCLALLANSDQHVAIGKEQFFSNFGTHCINFLFIFPYLVLLHRRGLSCNNSQIDNNVSVSAGQREMAAKWASEIINNQTKPHLFSIGSYLLL